MILSQVREQNQEEDVNWKGKKKKNKPTHWSQYKKPSIEQTWLKDDPAHLVIGQLAGGKS